MNKNYLKLSKSLSLFSLITFFSACSQNNQDLKPVQDWHPAINQQLTSLDQNNILTFGKMEKEDGKYCYVSYEGLLRNDLILKNTQDALTDIIKTIDIILKTDFSISTVELTQKSNITNLENLSETDLNYIHKKSELECLRILAERQVAKYSKKLSDKRISSK
jgi:hypothetical protein